MPLPPYRLYTLPIVEMAFLALALVSKSPPAIIGGEVQGVKNFDLVSFIGQICVFDTDGDGAAESFFIAEAWGEVCSPDEDYPVLFKIIKETDGKDTIYVDGFAVSGKNMFMSVGFFDASEDSVKDMALAFWDDSGASCLRLYDMSLNEGAARSRLASELRPGLKWASYDIAWPAVRVNSPYGKREYIWKDREWKQND